MRNEFTAIIDQYDEEVIAYCLEIPGANGQGKTREEALSNLSQVIASILEHRREWEFRGLPGEAVLETIVVNEPEWPPS